MPAEGSYREDVLLRDIHKDCKTRSSSSRRSEPLSLAFYEEWVRKVTDSESGRLVAGDRRVSAAGQHASRILGAA